METHLTFCGGLIPFIWDRLPLSDAADIEGRAPCLDEDWFVDDALDAGSLFVWRGRPAEESHRLLYRYARMKARERGEFGGNPHWLLLHQMATLAPVLVVTAVGLRKDEG